MIRYAKLDSQVLDVRGSSSQIREASIDKFSEFDNYRTEDGYLYARIRAISSRVNKNHDGWPSIELAGNKDTLDRHLASAHSSFTVEADRDQDQGFSTFLGKPIFIDHNNSNPQRARGVVVDAKLHVEPDVKTASDLDPYYATAEDDFLPPTWVELLLEVDAKTFPKFAKALVDGSKDPDSGLDGFSMGADITHSRCSHCDNVAKSPDEFCKHIKKKGKTFPFVDKKGKKRKKQSFEFCHGIQFFELSCVFDPADDTALTREVVSSLRKEADSDDLPQNDQTKVPEEVNTLRDEHLCPVCSSEMDGPECDVCFTPGTLVRTKQGYVPIETIEPGDEVLGENGRFNRVREVVETPFNGMLQEIWSNSFVEPVRATPNHPIRTLVGSHPERNPENRYCSPAKCEHHPKSSKTAFQDKHELKWAHAECLNERSYVALNRPEESFDLEYVDVPEEFAGTSGYKRFSFDDAEHMRTLASQGMSSEEIARKYDAAGSHVRKILRGEQWTKPSRRHGATRFAVTPEFLWAIGMYIAEGSPGDRSINYALHEDEVDYQQRLISFWESQGYTTSFRTRKNSKSAWVNVNSSVLAEWLPHWLGEGSAHKRIPAELLNLPDEKLGYVLEGVFDGDGHAKTDSLGQTSSILALQVAEIGLRRQESFRPTIQIAQSEAKKTVYTTNNTLGTIERRGPRKYARNQWYYGGKHLSRIQSIKEVPYWGPVYNLKVEGDPTYTVQNLLVHNCGYMENPEGFGNPDMEKAQEQNDQLRDQQNTPEETPYNADLEDQDQNLPPANKPMKEQVSHSVTNDNRSIWSVKLDSREASQINKREFPITPNRGRVSDRPNEEVIRGGQPPLLPSKSQPKNLEPKKPDQEPKTSAVRKQRRSMSNQRTAADPLPAARPDVNTDVGSQGGVMDANNESGSKADSQVTVSDIGSTPTDAVSAEETETVDQGNEYTKNVEQIPTKTWTDGNQHAPVGDQPFPPSDEGVQKGPQPRRTNWHIVAYGPAVEGVQPSDPVGDAEQRIDVTDVDYDVPLQRTETWTGTDGNGVLRQQDPSTGDAFPRTEDGVRSRGSSIRMADLQLADREIEMGMTDPSQKYARIAELSQQSEQTVSAYLDQLNRVRTAGLAKDSSNSAPTKSMKMPSLSKAASREASSSSEDDYLLDSAVFSR